MWPFRFAMHRKRGLRMMVVSLVEASPKNGVEIMDGIEAMTRGWWRPSPGSVYPLLEQLTGEGMLAKRADGRYELTPKAKIELEVSFGSRPGGPRTVEDALDELKSYVSFLEDHKRSGKGPTLHSRELNELSSRLKDLAKDE